MNIVFDAEANGLLDTVTECHCVCTDSIGYYIGHGIDEFFQQVIRYGPINETKVVLIGHNIIKYDLPMFKKVYDWDFFPYITGEMACKIGLIDTLVLSQLLNPDRPTPMGCKAGPHSLEAWGIRLGIPKPEHEDWSVFSPEMLNRCKEDVEINARVLKVLLGEAELTTTEELLKWLNKKEFLLTL